MVKILTIFLNQLNMNSLCDRYGTYTVYLVNNQTDLILEIILQIMVEIFLLNIFLSLTELQISSTNV